MATEEDPLPGVSYVMPVLNEAAYVESSIRTVLSQDYAGEQQLVLALGPSTDGTNEIVERLAQQDARLSYVHNPNTDIPFGLNLAVAASVHPIIVRVDAHSELAPGYTARAVVTLLRTGAANVGGLMKANGTTTFQKAVARAYNSRFGLGGGAYHGGDKEGPAESAYLGVFQRNILTEVGLYDETLRRGEDWELNLRIRSAGHVVWFDPTLQVTYWPRESWRKLARQFFTTGVWRAELVRRYGGRNPLRFFAPPVLVAGIPLTIVVFLLQVTGILRGLPGMLASVVYLALLLYLLVVAWVSFVSERSPLRRDRWSFFVVLLTMHVSWGAGFLRGIVLGGGGIMDTSRTDAV